MSTAAREALRKNNKPILKTYAYTIIIGLGAVALNLIAALKNNIPILDWVRGVIPFLFMFLFLPIAVLVENNESRIRWLGSSIGVLIFMSSAYIIFFYFNYDLWKPYWITTIDGVSTKISESDAINRIDAIGPLRDRITMQVAQATDAMLPVGLVMGVVLSTLARSKTVTMMGMLVAVTSLIAVLITFTRSMLLSSLVSIFIFSMLITLYHAKLRLKLLLLSMTLACSGAAFVYTTGMQDIWMGRVIYLFKTQPAAKTVITNKSKQDMPVVESNYSNIESALPQTKSIAAIASTKIDIEQNRPRETKPNISPQHQNLSNAAKAIVKSKNSEITVQTSNNEVPSSEALPPAVEALNNTNIVTELTEENAEETIKDVNVSSRLHEYGIAWKMFLANPALGNGFGVKHKMQWETSEGKLLTEYVGYVHNWPFYMLMVGGISGLALYTFVLLGPIFFRLTLIRSESPFWTLIRTVLITMTVYAAFFAVFRLITFNLLIAAIWGVVYAQILASRQKTNTSTQAEPVESHEEPCVSNNRSVQRLEATQSLESL
ncbi:hypothetical protein BK664_24900 [Pseudomonas brassicacearum]|uniref:Ligase n=2 Tax=Pseudomonas brassicacearum TaxID=930166 RepID=A0A423J7Q0_9PSED|nr:hypothetical protein BK664_24900 [Pseudomonas brassicacearum]